MRCADLTSKLVETGRQVRPALLERGLVVCGERISHGVDCLPGRWQRLFDLSRPALSLRDQLLQHFPVDLVHCPLGEELDHR